VSKKPRKDTWVRITIHETSTLKSIVMVGTENIRISVLMNGRGPT
jgi:hypothetical protein